jgi:hypothetical protein
MWDQNDPVKHSLKELGSELSQRRGVEDSAKERIRRPLRRDTKLAVGMAIVLALAMVVAAVNLFTHTFPSGTTGAHVTTACTTLTMGTPSVPVGQGTVRFNCGAATPAFAADGSGPVTPTFSLGGTLYTSLAIVTSAPIGTLCSGGTTLTSGTGLTPPAGSYDYCATFVGSGTLIGFPLTWSQ